MHKFFNSCCGTKDKQNVTEPQNIELLELQNQKKEEELNSESFFLDKEFDSEEEADRKEQDILIAKEYLIFEKNNNPYNEALKNFKEICKKLKILREYNNNIILKEDELRKLVGEVYSYDKIDHSNKNFNAIKGHLYAKCEVFYDEYNEKKMQKRAAIYLSIIIHNIKALENSMAQYLKRRNNISEENEDLSDFCAKIATNRKKLLSHIIRSQHFLQYLYNRKEAKKQAEAKLKEEVKKNDQNLFGIPEINPKQKNLFGMPEIPRNDRDNKDEENYQSSDSDIDSNGKSYLLEQRMPKTDNTHFIIKKKEKPHHNNDPLGNLMKSNPFNSKKSFQF